MNSNKNWTTISCQVENNNEETCSYLLFSLGSLGLEIKNINDNEQLIVASFDTNSLTQEKIEEFHLQLSQAKLKRAIETLKIESVKNEDWLSNWKKHFEPFIVGNSFLICPPWAAQKLKDKEFSGLTKIIIDPGMAFGTGLHITTSYCLRSIANNLHGKNVLDAGTGSGILSIAYAISSPQAKITAIDFDENSIENAKHNFELNKVESRIDLSQNNLESFDKHNTKKFDIILSNLTAEVIMECLPIYNKILVKEGLLILAGIIEERLTLIERTISQYPFKLANKNIESGWVGMIYIKG